MSSAGAVPIKTKLSTAAVGKAEAEIQAKQANVKDLKNIDIDSQHLNYEISSIPRESWWKTEEKDVNNDLSHFMSVFPIVYYYYYYNIKVFWYKKLETFDGFFFLSNTQKLVRKKQSPFQYQLSMSILQQNGCCKNLPSVK